MTTEEDVKKFWSKQRKLCAKIGRKAAGKKTRRVGRPVVEHYKAVADACKHNDAAFCMGWLHDVIEDGFEDEHTLLEKGVDELVIAGVTYLTHVEGTSYEDYVDMIAEMGSYYHDDARLIADEARMVKIADIVDNITDAPSAKQVKKYRKALWVLADIRGVE